jgi:tetratricopeptide (TPR) repeat protein
LASGRRRGRRRGVEIRPGSVKQARVESGLSLGQVARGDLSRTAIYFVETGKAKPSIETLRLIADRTNKPLDFFLGEAGVANTDPEAALADLERLLATGDPAGAAAAAERLIKATADPHVAARARVQLALALIRLGQHVRARNEAAQARAALIQLHDIHDAAMAMGYEAGAAGNVLDPAALSIAKEALALCRSITPVPRMLEARLLFILGHAYTQEHEYSNAVAVLEESVSLGTSIQDLRQLAMVYLNLSVNYQELGQFAQAAKYSHRAIAIAETLHDRKGLATAENSLALLLHMQGDLAGAFRHAENSLRIHDELGQDAGKAHILMTLSELELARDNHEAAARLAIAAREVAAEMDETLNVAESRVWLARALEAGGNRAGADFEFDAAFRLFDELGVVERKMRNRAIYAEILEARGDLVGANRQLKLALAAMGTGAAARREFRTATA